jgi:magnesium transporter
MKRFYEQLAIVIDRLVENENEAIAPDGLNRLIALNRRIHYLKQSVTDLRELVTQVREAYQARIDIEQNQIMKVFTVITAVFLPLTLIVGWYGMNFNIPEFGWRFGYLYVIILSVVVCVICVCIIKKKKWF